MTTEKLKTRAWVYLSKDSSRGNEEGQIYAEVVANPGEENETTLHATTWFTAPHPAINAAEKWMAENGVEHTAE